MLSLHWLRFSVSVFFIYFKHLNFAFCVSGDVVSEFVRRVPREFCGPHGGHVFVALVVLGVAFEWTWHGPKTSLLSQCLSMAESAVIYL